MSSSASRRRLVLPLYLGCALALGSCTKKEEPVVPGGDGAADPQAPVELAPVEHPSQLLPRDTVLLVTAASVSRAAEVFERDRLVQTFGPQYTSLSSAVRGVLGHDLLDPAVWPTVGLDPQGPVGMALLHAVHAEPIFFATIRDPVALTEFMRELAGKSEMELVETTYGAAKVLRVKGESGAVVMRDRLVTFVLDEGEVDLAQRIVTMDPNVSLASRVGYRKATGGLRAADLTLYLDALGMVEQQSAEAETRASAPQSNWAQDQLVEAQKRGDSPERLAQLERQAAQEEQQQRLRRQQAQGERALAELLVSGVEGVGLTVTVKRGGPIFDGRIVAGEDAFLRRLLTNRQGAPALTQAMNGAPLFCLSGQAEAEAALELVEAIAGVRGESPAELLARVKAESGLDLATELPALLTGPAELCVALEGELSLRDDNPARGLGLAAVVPLPDEAKAKYMLAKVASASGTLAGRMKKKGAGYVIGTDKWRDLHVQTQGNRVVLSTDPELAERLGSGKPGSMPSKIRPAAARGAIDLPGTAISEAFDMSSGLLWLMAGRMSFEGPMVVAPGLTPEQMAEIPHSGKSKKAKKVLDKAEARVEALEAKRDAAELNRLMEVMDPLGIVVAAATEDERGFTITGGQFLRVTSLGQVVEGLVNASLDREPALGEAEQETLSRAWEERNEADRVYTDARLEDAERFMAKKNKAKPR